MSNEKDRKAMESDNPPLGIVDPDARRIGEAARAGFKAVFPEWEGPLVSKDDTALRRAIEAQIAAASLGRKPLYFDPWSYDQALELVPHLQPHLAPGTEIHAAEEGLFVYRPEVIRPILDSDKAFYRPDGEDDLAAILRATRSGNNGDLLGYGGRHWGLKGGARVSIIDSERTLFMFFVSKPANAEFFAKARAKDIADYLGTDVGYTIDVPRKPKQT